MQKAFAWLNTEGIGYEFHDFRSQGIDRDKVAAWVKVLGWPTVLNRQGTTFRGLPDSSKDNLTAEKAVDLMVAQPAMIKRPIFEIGEQLFVGFKPGSEERARLESVLKSS